jgi:hypothetical protein
MNRFLFFYVQYQDLMDTLKNEAFLHRHRMMGFFIDQARANAWLIGLGTLLNRFLENLLYIFALVWAIGLTGIWRRIKGNLQVRYLVVLSISAILLLYLRDIFA